MGFTRKKLLDSDLSPFPDQNFLKNVFLKNVNIRMSLNIRKLFLTKWMKEVTLDLRQKERRELKEHIQHYMQSLTDKTGFKLVSCDRYSKEGRQGSKVLSTRSCSEKSLIVGFVSTTWAINDDLENKLALRGVDTLCILKPSWFDIFLSFLCLQCLTFFLSDYKHRGKLMHNHTKVALQHDCCRPHQLCQSRLRAQLSDRP